MPFERLAIDGRLASEFTQQALAAQRIDHVESEGGHLEGATHIPHDQIVDRIDEIVEKQGGDKSKPIITYCRSGNRAGTAKATLIEAGFENVSNLGGMSDWPE